MVWWQNVELVSEMEIKIQNDNQLVATDLSDTLFNMHLFIGVFYQTCVWQFGQQSKALCMGQVRGLLLCTANSAYNGHMPL